MTTPPFLGRALPARSTVQHSWGLTYQGDRHLEHRHYTTVPGYGSATVDAREPQCLESWIGDAYSVSISEALQLPSCPIIPAPLLACNSNLVGYLSGEPGSAQLALSSGYVAGEIRTPSIGHASNYITNHDTTLPLSYTNPLQSFFIGQSSGYPQESGDVSIFGDLDNSFAGPTMNVGPIPSFHDSISGQVISSDASWSWPSNPPLPLPQEPRLADYFVRGDILLPQEQTRTGMVVPP
ncbi:hypothetical protein EV401DRAFT_1131341 [Pisolithus croceorrhizus]|nr:hypothetical protein EV401DRAFT_1131341 [Pisolithus croceorrhizus]